MLQESGNFPEVIEKLHKSVLYLSKTFTPSFRKQRHRLSKTAALDTLAVFAIVKIVFSEKVARLRVLL